ncbi:alpha/beta hydrolase [Bdellovibrio reynosensis]|uniref:Alpha/beta hydrolase n=1 Tax=Bdellovibrio reynosensis TaxID=2835041 RepID=A0ABY4CAE8_9BACT|nr:alpha/beta hydrolase [Bdellovibrio reynosensis]UOF00872.1 alpha/beta hydrolase [Bdellovibrio reynosensis]
MGFILKIALLILLVLALFAAGIYYYQERLIFFPTVLPEDYKYSFASSPEEIKLTYDKKDVYALRFKAPGESKGIVFFFHGNAGALDSWGYFGEEFAAKTSWDIVVIDYPGYGKSQGRVKSEEDLRNVGQLFINHVTENISTKMVIFGRSIGSGVATFLAAKNPCDGVILETPFYSGIELAKILFPQVPSFLIRYAFRSDEWLSLSQGKILILHGTEDSIVPYSQGLKLSQVPTAQALKFVTIQGGDHNNLSDFEEYWDEVNGFLQTL